MIGEKNQTEDMSSLVESIEWKYVSFETMLEFVLKFSKNVEKFEYESVLLRLMEAKFSDGKNGVLNNIISIITLIKIDIVIPSRK